MMKYRLTFVKTVMFAYLKIIFKNAGIKYKDLKVSIINNIFKLNSIMILYESTRKTTT